MMRLSYHSCVFIFMSFFAFQLNAEKLSPAEKKLEEIMEIHYLKPEMRSSEDLTQIQGDEGLIQVWRDLPPEPKADEIECLGYQWLISGRGAKIGEGALAAFQALPELQSIELKLVDLGFESESVNKRGQLTRKIEPKLYLRMKLKRSEMLKYSINIQQVKKDLRADTETCLRIGRRLQMEREIKL